MRSSVQVSLAQTLLSRQAVLSLPARAVSGLPCSLPAGPLTRFDIQVLLKNTPLLLLLLSLCSLCLSLGVPGCLLPDLTIILL